jgi:hypothetical protein
MGGIALNGTDCVDLEVADTISESPWDGWRLSCAGTRNPRRERRPLGLTGLRERRDVRGVFDRRPVYEKHTPPAPLPGYPDRRAQWFTSPTHLGGGAFLWAGDRWRIHPAVHPGEQGMARSRRLHLETHAGSVDPGFTSPIQMECHVALSRLVVR